MAKGFWVWGMGSGVCFFTFLLGGVGGVFVGFGGLVDGGLAGLGFEVLALALVADHFLHIFGEEAFVVVVFEEAVVFEAAGGHEAEAVGFGHGAVDAEGLGIDIHEVDAPGVAAELGGHHVDAAGAEGLAGSSARNLGEGGTVEEEVGGAAGGVEHDGGVGEEAEADDGEAFVEG